MCEARDAARYNDLCERQQCRAAFREAKGSDIFYHEDERMDVTIGGQSLKVFGSPSSLATSSNTAFVPRGWVGQGLLGQNRSLQLSQLGIDFLTRARVGSRTNGTD